MNIQYSDGIIINFSSLKRIRFYVRLFFSKIYYGERVKNYSGFLHIIILNIFTLKDPFIVLADDDQDDRELFEEAIAEVNAEVKLKCVKNGEELMNLLTATEGRLPDMVFLDLNMPAKNGLECLKEIRSDNKLMNIPVIIYSTSSHSEQIEKTFSGGANFYFPKSASFEELKEIAKKIFSFDWDKMPKPSKDSFLLRS